MRTARQFKEYLESVDPSLHVYEQAPTNNKMQYPCIKFMRKSDYKLRADNIAYAKLQAYEVIYISTNPEDGIADKIADLEYCSFDRHYVVERLHHDVFTIYF